MIRRNFIAAFCALLAAPFSLFAKRAPRFPSWYPPIDPNGVSTWENRTACYNEEAVRQWNEEYAEKLAKEEKARGPWRIVEQTEGHVKLERADLPEEARLYMVASYERVTRSGQVVSLVLKTNPRSIAQELYGVDAG